MKIKSEINNLLTKCKDEKNGKETCKQSGLDLKVYGFEIAKGWHFDRMGISLLDACVFDVRDTLVCESQLEQFKNEKFTGGTGPSKKIAIEKIRGRILEVADCFG